ncbi:MAG: putative metalloprotease with PDZ domain [Planctomycetota bacterium]|jgi:predicted metalloprotease with PDZ domain
MSIRFSLLLVLTAPSFAQTNRDDLTPLEISYTTTVAEDLQSLDIVLDVQNVNRPTLRLYIPEWSPGAYGLRDTGDRIQSLRVTGGADTELALVQMDKNSWSVATEGRGNLRVTYSVPGGRRRGGRGANSETITGMNVSGPSTYMYVGGGKDVPVTSRYIIPEGWKVANGLLRTDDSSLRHARDYDTFIDAPTILGHFEEREFSVYGTPFTCVFFEQAQEYDFDIDAFVAIVERIVINQGQLYGSFPFPNYIFLFSLPGGGGLEHLNSTSIGLQAGSQRNDVAAGASVTSHEFFHTWNVKRIRPVTLGPFDYQQENYTGNLWVSEGWTSYFGDLTLARINLWDRERYLGHLSGIVNRELNKPRRRDHSVTWASRNSWHRFNNEEGSRVDYYGKGELLGLMLDLKIRHETNGTKSLNDVMRFMNRWFAERNVGFEEGDVERACTAVSNYDFSEFFARHVVGTMDPPLGEYLAYAGVGYSEEIIPCSFPFSLRRNRIGGRRLSEDPTPQQLESPLPGETLASVDGEEFGDRDEFLKQHQAGDVVVLTLERNGESRELEVTLSEETRMIPTLTWDENATDKQLAIREAWLTSVN